MADVTAIVEEMQRVLGAREPSPQGDDPGLTQEEWSKEWGITRDATYRRLRELNAAGLLVVGKRPILTLSGHLQRVPVYRARTA